MALATGTYAKAEGVAEDDPSWDQLRGVSYVRRAVAEDIRSPAFPMLRSYVRRAVAEDIRSPAFPMLRNQAGVGGVGTYWVTLVAGGLVEDDAGRLTLRGTKLADVFLLHRATPDRASLVRIISGEDITFAESVLADWGRAAHLGAASPREQRLLADALLEPDAHRRMASAMQATEAVTSDGDTFRLLSEHLGTQRDPLSDRLAAVLAVASSFENLHRELVVEATFDRSSSRRPTLGLMADGARRSGATGVDERMSVDKGSFHSSRLARPRRGRVEWGRASAGRGPPMASGGRGASRVEGRRTGAGGSRDGANEAEIGEIAEGVFWRTRPKVHRRASMRPLVGGTSAEDSIFCVFCNGTWSLDSTVLGS